jgi:hypothetical protein
MLDATQRHLLLVKTALLVLIVHLVKTAHVKTVLVMIVRIVILVILVMIVARALIEILAHEPGNDMTDLIEETEVLDA